MKVKFTEESRSFINSLNDSGARDKIYDITRRVEQGDRNPEIFKKLSGSEIWEFRMLFAKIAYRLFAFWDTREDALVITTHGIIKKTQKTPTREIRKAERIRQEYFNNK